MKTIDLDPIVERAGYRVAAVVQRRTSRRVDRRSASVSVAKLPLAVVVDDHEGLRAFDVSGAPLSLEALERLCPDAVAAFGR